MGSGASKEALGDLHVVIIGGGYGGVQAAASLRNAGIKFTIIDPKEYFHHCIAALRAAVCSDFVQKTGIPLKEAFGDSFIQDTVQKIDIEGMTVVLNSGKELKFTHCIIAVGSIGPSPARTEQLTLSGMAEEYRNIGDAIEAAENIVIVGGGAVGVEFAGEITDKYKAKNVTIVSSSEKLICPDFDDKFYANLDYYINAADVKVIKGRVSNLNDLVTNQVQHQVVVVDDQRIEADLVLSCIGLPPNKKSIESLLPLDHIDVNGRVKVTEYLTLHGNSRVIAIGDCCNTNEHKMGVFAMKHAELVVANIVKEAAGSAPSPWVRPFTGMLIPFGSKVGSAVANGWHLPNIVARPLKYADLATSKTWAMVGLKAPT